MTRILCILLVYICNTSNLVSSSPGDLSSQLNPVYAITASLSKIYFNIVHPLRMLAEEVIFILEVTGLNLKWDADCNERVM